MKPSLSNNLANLLTSISINSPRAIYLAVALLAAFMLIQLPKVDIDTDPENMLRADNPARLFHNQVKQQFNLYDAIVLGVVHSDGIYNPTSLAITKQLSDYVMNLDGVVHSEVIAPSLVDNIENRGAGELSFSWLMPSAPKNQQQSAQVQRAIERLPLLHNTMASGDGKAIAVYIPLVDKDNSYQIAEQLRQFTKTLAQDHQYYITGLPVAENQFGFEMFVQMAISAPLAGAMIFLMLWLFLRQSVVVMGAMLIAMSTVIITMGSLIGAGFSVHILSSMIAIFLMPIAVVDAIHVLSEFKEKLQHNKAIQQNTDHRDIIREVIADLFQPMLFTTLTSAVGFLSLMLTPIPPVKVFGGFVALGIFLAFILTMTLLPAYLSRLNPKTIAQLAGGEDASPSLLHRLLKTLSALSQNHYNKVIAALTLFTLFGIIGIGQIVINDNPVRWFKADHQISIADKALNQHFAGTYNAYLVLEHTSDSKTNHKTVSAIYDAAAALALPLEATQDIDAATLLTQLDDLSFEVQLSPQQSEFVNQAIAKLSNIAQQKNSFYQPQQLAYIDQLAQHLRQTDQVGKVNALSDVVRTVNRELISGRNDDYTIPHTHDGVAQVLLQYQSSHRPNDLMHFVTPQRDATLLWLQLKDGDNQTMQAVISATDAYIANHPLPSGISYKWAGKAYINVVWQQAMVAGMAESLAGAFVFVLLMMIALFKSIRYGLLAMLPLTITIIGIYGLIGWIGKDYDMPIAVLSSLTLGLSVDFAIHFIERYRQLRRLGHDITSALSQMFNEPARAISRNALVIAFGFTPLLFAPLVPYVTVGLFLASIMLISAVVTLTLIPAVVTFSHPKKELS